MNQLFVILNKKLFKEFCKCRFDDFGHYLCYLYDIDEDDTDTKKLVKEFWHNFDYAKIFINDKIEVCQKNNNSIVFIDDHNSFAVDDWTLFQIACDIAKQKTDFKRFYKCLYYNGKCYDHQLNQISSVNCQDSLFN